MRNILPVLLLLGATQTKAQTPVPTWSENVACILYSNCTTCHHDGGIAPFSLMTYQDAMVASFGVMNAVNSGAMPPWPPDRGYRQFAHERYLTQQEKDIITAWANGGTPQGDPGLAPPMPTYTNPEDITDPDLVVTMPQYSITTTGTDLYRCFVISSNLTEDVYITDLEVVPGNREAVHHVLVYSDTSDVPVQLDAADPLPGYLSFGGTGSNDSKLIGAWVPGQRTKHYPTGMGVKLLAGSSIVMQIHYPASANGMNDQTKINIKYTSGGFVRELFIASPLNHADLNEGILALPPDQVTTFTSDYQVPNNVNITVLDVAPHMHLIGKSVKAWANTPQGDTIRLINIPDWDFHWQGFYDFRQPLKIPAGSTIRGISVYDNTTANFSNPNNPPAWVFGGESTTEEMMLVYFTYTLYFPGDENIVIDTSTVRETWADCYYLTNVGVGEDQNVQSFQVQPNPTDGILTVIGDAKGRSVIEVISADGRLLFSTAQVGERTTIDLTELAPGPYLLRATDPDGVRLLRVMRN
jgi:hypothetical protein